MKGWREVAKRIKQTQGRFEKQGVCRYCLALHRSGRRCQRKGVRMSTKRDKRFMVLMSQKLRGTL